MGNVAGQVHSVEAVVQTLRTNNAAKLAALGSVAQTAAIRAALQRLSEYTEAYAHAHETGNLEEAQGIAIAMTRAAMTLQTATTRLDDALARELVEARAAA
jgi:hypothetical protein